MLIPRFSLRLLLLVTTISGLFFFVVAQAIRGHDWAMALSVALTASLAAIVLQAMVFGLAWTVTMCWRIVGRRQTTGSPFATASPPPQVIPPIEPE